MENPFRVKVIAEGDSFFNRKKEIVELMQRAREGQHTLLIAPRRFGKSSLLHKVKQTLLENYSMRVVYVDLFMCANLSEFCRKLIKNTIATYPQGAEKFFTNVRKILPRLAPKITLSGTGEPEFSFGLKANSVDLEDVLEVLLWLDKTNTHNLIILDEIQEITEFPESEKIEKKLRSIIQSLKNTTVFYSGSMPTILRDMFTKRSRAFYQSALSYELKFVPLPEASAYLKSMLTKTKVSDDFIDSVAKMTSGHPYYVQLSGYLCFQNWRHSLDWSLVTVENILQSLFELERSTFENAIVALTPVQKSVYRAIAREPHQAITSMDYLARHNLSAHSSVRKAVQKLEALGYVQKDKDGYQASDPIQAKWWAEC